MIYINEISPPLKVSGLSSVICKFDYNPATVEAIKSIPNARYLKKEKLWEVPINSLTLLLDTLTFVDDITFQL